MAIVRFLSVAVAIIQIELLSETGINAESQHDTPNEWFSGKSRYITKGEYAGGSCSNLNEDPGLCHLTKQCNYNNIENSCEKTPDCSVFDDDAAACRLNQCYFDCGTRMCHLQATDSGVLCKSCGDNCNDVCSCTLSECTISTDGSCRNQKKECSTLTPKNYPCVRSHAIYWSKDGCCVNMNSRGTCGIEENLLGVNFGGDATVDSVGRGYMADKDVPFEDTYNLRLEKLNTLAPDLLENQELYIKSILLDPRKRMSGRCLKYNLTICKDGVYEFSLKLLSPTHPFAGEKTFNIKLAGKYVYQEMDLKSFTDEKMADLVLYFRVKNNLLLLFDDEAIRIVDGRTTIEFCYSECIFSESYLDIAAFSVVRLVTAPIDNTDPHFCSEFNGNQVSCEQVHCKYNYQTQICTIAAEDCPTKMNNTSCKEKKCVELLFLLDSTPTGPREFYEPDSLVFDKFQDLRNVVDTIQLVYPCSKFGIALFSEFSCQDFVDYGQDYACTKVYGNGVHHHNDPEGCYRRHQVLTTDTKIFKESGERSKLTFRFSTDAEPGMFVAALAAQDLSIGWTVGAARTKIIILVTDDDTNILDMLKKSPPKFDGSDTCRGTNHPSNTEINYLFKREGIAILVIGAPPAYTKRYESVLFSLTVPYRITDIKRTTLELTKDITDFVTSLRIK